MVGVAAGASGWVVRRSRVGEDVDGVAVFGARRGRWRRAQGVFVAFEECPAELAENVASAGIGIWTNCRRAGYWPWVRIRISDGEIVQTGASDLDGLFIRLGAAIDEVGANRVVLDTVEALFGPLGDGLS